MKELRHFLDDVDYDQAQRALFGPLYGKASLFDHPELAGKPLDALRAKIARLSLSERQKLALRVFCLGDATAAKTLFAKQASLLALLPTLRGLTISSHRLGARTLYLLSELPRALSGRPEEPTAMLYSPSYALLRALEELPPTAGVVVDFGSGVGIQAIALLTLHGRIARAIGVDIDATAHDLARRNAQLNDVAHRFETVDNTGAAEDLAAHRPDPLARALRGAKASLVVTNPPFNLVPSSLGEKFTKYGYGGPDGLAVTKLFLRQALPQLSDKGSMVIYGQLALDTRGEPLLAAALREDFPKTGLHVTFDRDPHEAIDFSQHQRDVAVYAQYLRSYLSEHLPPDELPSEDAILSALRAAKVASLRSVVTRIVVDRQTSGCRIEALPKP